MTWWDRLKYEFDKNPSPVRKLIIVNVGIFILSYLFVFVVSQFVHPNGAEQAWTLVKNFFYTPSAFAKLLIKPWTLFTYMFFHAGFRHILGNMLMLYFIGRILSDFMNNRKFYTIYFGGGVAGALLFVLIYNLIPSLAGGAAESVLLGASGGVIAIVMATAVLVPNYELFLFGAFRVKMKWIAMYLVFLDIFFFNSGNQGGHLAHIGGAIFGALFILREQGRISFDMLKNIRNPFKPKYTILDERQFVREKKRETVKTASSSKSSHHRASGKPHQEEIDAILDKINESGYSSLTKEEKELLFRASDQ